MPENEAAQDSIDSPTDHRDDSVDLIAKVRAETQAGAKKSWPVLLLILGFGLMFFGELGIYLLEESPREIAQTVLEEQSRRASLPSQSTAPEVGHERPLWERFRAVAIFLCEVTVKFGELLVLGVFLELLLHSNHYAKFYLRLVEEAMLGRRLAKRLGNSASLWKNISEVYFSRRFPLIKDRLTETLYSYFPTEHKYYLNDYRYNMRFQLKEGTFITATEEISYTVVPADPDEPVPFILRNAIFRRGAADMVTSGKVLGARVGAKDLAAECRYVEKELGDKHVLELNINREDLGSGERHVSIRLEKTWDISLDPYKNFTINSLVNDLKVEVECGDGLALEWLDVGVRQKFENVYSDLTPRRIDKQYVGLIFQNQGFRIIIRKV